jgi:hypothetical protein
MRHAKILSGLPCMPAGAERENGMEVPGCVDIYALLDQQAKPRCL